MQPSFDRAKTCCFTGYRPEKMPFFDAMAADCRALDRQLRWAIEAALDEGYTCFLNGMSRGFDLWAARVLLDIRAERPLELWCAIPFSSQEQRWEDDWRSLYQQTILRADKVFCLSEHYVRGCYHTRDRFMVDGSSRMICFYDGLKGGTRFTFRLARAAGLRIDNLADAQLSLFGARGQEDEPPIRSK